MITLEAVAARRAPLTLARLSLSWGPGVCSLVGTLADGGPLLLQVIAGRARLRSGRVRVLEASPLDATVRGQIALVSLEPPLPEALRTSEVLAMAAALRGEPAGDPVVRLAALGIESLAPRRVRTLAPEEARAVALAEALTSTRVRVLLLEEPLVGVDPRAAARLPDRLRARGRDGCAVLVATASLRDAGDLADDHVLLRGGTVVGRAPSLDALAAFSPEGVRMRILVSDPRALLAALAGDAAVDAVARRDGAVVARGRDATALAAAVGRAVVASGVDLTEMRIEPPSMDEARGAVAGVAAATYEAAHARTRAALALPSEGPPP
jgi:ABC-type multidrug transport system ATPase subunit